MALYAYLEILLIPISVMFLYFLMIRTRKKSFVPTNWPVLGMLPGLLHNANRIHEFATEILEESNGTFEFKGPWFCNMDMLLTSDPANIHHVFSKNFPNYPKGPEFRKIFEILGDGIFNADFELWEFHRKTTLSLMTQTKFYSFLERNMWEKIEGGLIPVLDGFLEKGVELDLQDVFQRFTFDNICKLVLGYDPESLSVDLPYIPCEKAFNGAVEALMHRHIVPEWIWKLQKWLQIGKEKTLMKAWKSFDEFIYPRVSINDGVDKEEDDFNMLKSFDRKFEEIKKYTSRGDSREFLRDTSLNLMLAGRDTTSTCLAWLFWLLAANPSAERKIRQEIEDELQEKEDKKWRNFSVEESKKLKYLHGALCESLRLFPPVALEHKAPIRPDILPTGNHIPENKMVVLCFYSMGRMEMVWGKDCLDFKPERWILERGGTKHEPSYKFPAFNAGPRTCLGKEMAFIQMKMVAASVIYRYNIEVVKGHKVSASDSVIIQMKHGLRVKLSKRNVC
ncbi:alkane hydroxylase MAH1-like [Primulina eburnea]|uniref:alkane hydroxylase MAH1-like n=1 Tax=Primulina eburnea TaxID=1245227 RepID=UPI003C6C3690